MVEAGLHSRIQIIWEKISRNETTDGCVQQASATHIQRRAGWHSRPDPLGCYLSSSPNAQLACPVAWARSPAGRRLFSREEGGKGD